MKNRKLTLTILLLSLTFAFGSLPDASAAVAKKKLVAKKLFTKKINVSAKTMAKYNAKRLTPKKTGKK